jgi:hypothetical protein
MAGRASTTVQMQRSPQALKDHALVIIHPPSDERVRPNAKVITIA